MIDKENPSSENHRQPTDPVEAILVDESDSESDSIALLDASTGVVIAELMEEPAVCLPVLRPLENLSAKGGAITSLVLGSWSIVGAFITPYSVINALLGLAFGCWGMSSNLRWPWLGLALSAVGVVVCCMMASVK